MRISVAVWAVLLLSISSIVVAGEAFYTGAGDAVKFPSTWGESGTTAYGRNSITFSGRPDVERLVTYLPTEDGALQGLRPGDFEYIMTINSVPALSEGGSFGIGFGPEGNFGDHKDGIVLGVDRYTGYDKVMCVVNHRNYVGSLLGTDHHDVPIKLRMIRSGQTLYTQVKDVDDPTWVDVVSGGLDLTDILDDGSRDASTWDLDFVLFKAEREDQSTWVVDDITLSGLTIPDVNQPGLPTLPGANSLAVAAVSLLVLIIGVRTLKRSA